MESDLSTSSSSEDTSECETENNSLSDKRNGKMCHSDLTSHQRENKVRIPSKRKKRSRKSPQGKDELVSDALSSRNSSSCEHTFRGDQSSGSGTGSADCFFSPSRNSGSRRKRSVSIGRKMSRKKHSPEHSTNKSTCARNNIICKSPHVK